jgi:hypothetical protein
MVVHMHGYLYIATRPQAHYVAAYVAGTLALQNQKAFTLMGMYFVGHICGTAYQYLCYAACAAQHLHIGALRNARWQQWLHYTQPAQVVGIFVDDRQVLQIGSLFFVNVV